MEHIDDFEGFKVHKINDSYSFIHIEITDKKKFLEHICKYILKEDNLLQYTENNTDIAFKPSPKNYAKLYLSLDKFIDDENIELEIDDDALKAIIKEEGDVVGEEYQRLKVRLSKIGRIGEYIFHLILSKYFKFTCILPKVSFTTNKNMSVFGIDELFLCKSKKMILFGESKVTKSLSNGISLINKSLETYEKMIQDEYKLVLKQDRAKGLEIFEGRGDICISFKEFIQETGITQIGIPLFVAHGGELDTTTIANILEKKVKKKKFFDLDTIYYVVSLPIIDKDEFIQFLTLEIKHKMEEYDGARRD